MKLKTLLKYLTRGRLVQPVVAADYDLPEGKYKIVTYAPKRNHIIVLGEDVHVNFGSRSETDVMSTLTYVELLMDAKGKVHHVSVYDNSHEPIEDCNKLADFESMITGVYKKVAR